MFATILNVGINKSIENELSLGIYTNPNNGIFTVEMSKELLGEDLYIYSISGNVANTIRTISEKQVIDTSDLADGVYFIRY